MDKYLSAWPKLSLLAATIYLVAIISGLTNSTFTLFSYAFSIYYDLIGVVPLVGLIIWIIGCIHAKTQIWTQSGYLLYSILGFISVACAGLLCNFVTTGNNGLYFTASVLILNTTIIFVTNHQRRTLNGNANRWFTDDNMFDMSVFNGFLCSIYAFSSGIVTLESLTGGALVAIATFIGSFLVSLIVYSCLWWGIGISKWIFSGFHIFKNPNK